MRNSWSGWKIEVDIEETDGLARDDGSAEREELWTWLRFDIGALAFQPPSR